jgi:hypothetical protein
MPLSAGALCWKKIIHGVTVAPTVEASSSSVLTLPPGMDRKSRELTTAPASGLAMIAASRNRPLKAARPSATATPDPRWK